MRLPNWRFKGAEAERAQEVAPVQDNAWPDMFANLQSAYAELTNTQFELERRSLEIAETRDLVQQIISSMSEALFLADRSGRVIRANPAASDLLGCEEEAILGRLLSVVCNCEELPATPWKLIEMANGGRTVTLDVEVSSALGTLIPVSFSLTLMHDKQDKITGVLAVARDMREQRHLIDSLISARTRFQELLEFAPDAMVLANPEGEIVLVNSQTERLFGYNREVLLGQNVEILVPQRYRKQPNHNGSNGSGLPVSEARDADDDFSQAVIPADELPQDALNGLMLRNAGASAQQVEFAVVDAEGREFLTEINQRPIVTEDGVLLMSVIRDISDRKRIQQELRNSEARHRALAETAQDVIVTMDEARTILFINSAVQRVFGYDPQELLGQPVSVLMPQGVGQPHAEQQPVGTGQLRQDWTRQEATGLRKDGSEVLLEISNSQFKQQGQLLYTAFIRDITERRQFEQKLNESEERYRNVALTAAEAIITVNDQAVIQFANPAVTRVFGFEAQDLLGHNVVELIPEYQQHIHKVDVAPGTTARGYDWKGIELRGLHKNGHEIPLEVSFNEFVREGERLRTGIIRDITARKQAQERVTRQTALRLALSNVMAAPAASAQQVLQRGAATVAEQLHVSSARLWLLDEPNGALVLQAAAGPVQTEADALIALGHGRVGQIAAHKEPQLINSQAQLFDHGDRDTVLIELDETSPALVEHDWSEQAGLLGFAGYPLLAGDNLLGVLAVYAQQPFAEDMLSALGAAADAIVLGLERQHTADERASLQEREAARINHQAALRVEISSALNQLDSTQPQMLQSCAQAIVNHAEAALARVWLLNDAGDALLLQASAGLCAPLNGLADAIPTLPNGHNEAAPDKIALIAAERRSYLTNEVLNDPQFGDKEWVAREGLSAFAGYPLVAQGQLLGVLAIFARQEFERDTINMLAAVVDLIVLGIERRRVEAARNALLEKEQEARREAEAASRLKDDFLAMVSHELRAPLTSILGWAQMLRSGGLDRTAAERALQTIERNAQSQAHLVGDLLDASRIATGKLRLDKQPLELKQLIESAIDAVRPGVEAKTLRLQIVMEPWVGPFEGDPERMKQIVGNLLSNAVKFTPPNGLIEVRLEKMEDKALLIISDTGQGIEPEFLPYVFDRFRQADSSAKRQQGGLGLGLAIVKSLVELHGGAIYAYSAGKGHGSDFMVTLPLAAVVANAADSELWKPDESTRTLRGGGSLRGVRVLVVDDERDTREILAVMLGRFGAEVRSAASAAEGLTVLQAWRPDLLVSDIGMPGEDGYVFISKVRALTEAAGSQTPAIALTAFASHQDRQQALASGFQMHLAKPVEPVELARRVARTLGRSETGIEL